MNNSRGDFEKIKECFGAMKDAPPMTGSRRELAQQAAKFMKPRQDKRSQRILAERIMFICFDE